MRKIRPLKIVLPAQLRLVLAVLLTALPIAGCSGSGTTPPATAGPVGSPTGRFTGSEACRECHSSEYAAWLGSRHRQTLRAWAPGQPLRLASAKIAPPYRVDAGGQVEGPGQDGKPVTGQVAFLVGGRHREDAVVRLADGTLQVFPLSFDADRDEAFEPLLELAGGATPPPDSVDFWTRFGRNADLACYGCHATGQTIRSEGVSSSGVTLPGSRWIEPGVGCEGCHGPGGPHITAARAGNASTERLKMGRGSNADALDACAACHGLRDVLPSPFSDEPAHRYGEPLSAAADPLMSVASNFEFREPFFPDLRPSTYQQEAIALSQSGCARKGGLTCAACHDVHSGAATPALAANDGGDSVCATCHATQSALGTRHTLHAAGSAGGRCLACHMASILRGPGQLPARDHSMAPPAADAGKIPAACASCHAGEKDGAVATKAWTRIAETSAARRRREIGVAVEGAETPSGVAALVSIAADPGRGWFLRWAAVQRILGTATAKRTDAMAAALGGMLRDPNPALRRAASRALGRFGRASDIGALQAATDDADPWTALAAVHSMDELGAQTAATRFSELIQRPDLVADARAQYAFGHARLLAHAFPTAEAALRRALTLNPMMVGAINDLGLCLMGQGHGDEAAKEWVLALAINPRFAPARRNLDAAATPPKAP